MSTSTGATVFWVTALLVLAMGLTVAGFLILGPLPEDRGETFYTALVSTGVAEVVLFGYLLYVLVVPRTVTRPSQAVRNRIMVLVVLWFAGVLVTNILVAPAREVGEAIRADRVIFGEALGTFVLLLVAYFLHRQDVSLQVRSEAPQRERTKLQSYAGGVDGLLASLHDLGRRRAGAAAGLGALAKRLDTLKTELLTASPNMDREAGRMVEPASAEEVAEHLRGVHERVGRLSESAGVSDEDFGARLDEARQVVDRAVAALRHRQGAVTF